MMILSVAVLMTTTVVAPHLLVSQVPLRKVLCSNVKFTTAKPPIIIADVEGQSPEFYKQDLCKFNSGVMNAYNLKGATSSVEYNPKGTTSSVEYKRQNFMKQSSILNTDILALYDDYSLPCERCDQAHRSLSVVNAGGKSEISEAYSMDYIYRNFGGDNFIFEKEVEYIWTGYSILDYLCIIRGTQVSVSVTRAMRQNDSFTSDYAEQLMEKKLNGLYRANSNLINPSSSGLLHVWCQDTEIVNTLTDSLEVLIDEEKIMPSYETKMPVTMRPTIIFTVCPSSCIYTNKFL